MERLCRKVLRAVCAELMLPESSADPMSLSRLEKDASVADEAVALLETVFAAVLVDVLPVESPVSKLVRLSNADFAEVRSPELIEVNRLMTSCATSLSAPLDVSELDAGAVPLGGLEFSN